MVPPSNPKRPLPEVLLVDDVPTLLRSIGSLLESEFQVIGASSGPEALELLARTPSIKVVISDYNMPGMNGVEFFREAARRHPATSRVLLTGVPQLEIAREAIEASALHRFLCKPCGADELRSVVRGAVEAHDRRAEDQLETEVLQFSNESLSTFNRSLEERFAEQSNSIQALQELGVELRGEGSLDGIAKIAAQGLSDALEGRGVHVQVHEGSLEFTAACAGPEMSTRMFSEPLTFGDESIGEIVIDLLNSEGQELHVSQRRVLSAMANMVALALHDGLRQQEHDRAQNGTLLALARLNESRDTVTGRHLERVGEYSRLIAEGLLEQGRHRAAITPNFLRDLASSAPLHDLGKVGIPDSILLATRPLTQAEWEIMETHTTLGADTLRQVSRQTGGKATLQMAVDIALSHHEQWDGGGYPAGLRGEEIPLAARIVALADVYDALTTERPYKRAWSHDEACAWIREQRGKHFDPILADNFLAREGYFREAAERMVGGEGMQPVATPKFLRRA